MKMNNSDIEKWINALRSKKFKQTKYYLQNKSGYCCLGVACSIFIPQNKFKNHNGVLYGNVPEDQWDAPIWLKRINVDFYLKTGKYLSHLNDDLNFTFDEIADLLQLVYIHDILESNYSTLAKSLNLPYLNQTHFFNKK